MKFKPLNALLAALLYLYMALMAASGGPFVLVLVAAYVVGCMVVARAMIAGAESRRTGNAVEFAQENAIEAVGIPHGSFHHVYHCVEDVNDDLRSALAEALRERLGCTDFREIALVDVDRSLQRPETRTFVIASAPQTARRSEPMLMCSFAKVANVQSVRWWILVSGIRDPNKLFWRYALAPFTVPFVAWPYVKREYDPLSGLKTVYPGFFNAVDVLNRTREVQYVAFETLVEVLDSFGIDTTDLKNQKANILNVNVSGGKASFGAVVQGAMNKVSGSAGAAS